MSRSHPPARAPGFVLLVLRTQKTRGAVQSGTVPRGRAPCPRALMRGLPQAWATRPSQTGAFSSTYVRLPFPTRPFPRDYGASWLGPMLGNRRGECLPQPRA